LINQSFKAWSNNRGLSRIEKFSFWKNRPIGAIIRTIEFLTLGTSLQNLIRSHNDINEIKHLLKNLEVLNDNNDYLIRKTRITATSGLILLESGHVIARNLDSHAFLSGSLNDELRVLVKGKRELQIEGLVLFVPKQYFYYHFLIDFLPYVLRAVEAHKGLNIVLSEDNPDFVFNYFKLHNLNFQTVSNKAINVESLISLNFTGMPLEEVRRYLYTEVDTKEPRLRKIAFLRNRGARFDAELESNIKTYLLGQGFSVIDPDRTSQEEQITLFSNAEEVAAVHGGVLANLIYCNEGTKVLEVFSHPYRTYFFQALAKDLKLQYQSMEVHDFS
jgi:capsular polysaccharide biosynthesis protein